MKKLLVLMLLAVPIAAANAAESKRIQCWNDKNGNRMCGDRVPPEYAGEKREIIQDGRVIETKRGAKTPEEIAEEARQKEAAKEAERRAQYDRALLESYRNVNDIETMRDERLAMFDGRIRAAEKSTAENQKTLEELRARQKPVPEGEAAAPSKEDAKLAKQIRQYEKALADSQKSLQRLKDERAQTEAKFDADAKRFLELRPPPAPKPAETAGSQ